MPFSKDKNLKKIKSQIQKISSQPRHASIQTKEELVYNKLLKTLPENHKMLNSEIYNLACRLVTQGLQVDDVQFSEKVNSYLRRRNNQLAQREALKRELEQENFQKNQNSKKEEFEIEKRRKRKLDFLNPKNKNRIPVAFQNVKKNYFFLIQAAEISQKNELLRKLREQLKEEEDFQYEESEDERLRNREKAYMKTQPFSTALIGISPITSFMARGSPKRQQRSPPRLSSASNYSMSRYRI